MTDTSSAESHKVSPAEYMTFHFSEQTVSEEQDSKITFCLQRSVEVRRPKLETAFRLSGQGWTENTHKFTR
jgi:hypothetical protein